MATSKIGRNSACPCGSGRKYKQCCEAKQQRMSLGMRVVLVATAAAVIGGIVLGVTSITSERAPAAGRVWSPEHNHYH
jgi:SEC-C motif